MPDVVQITLPDGSSKQVAAGTTVFDFVKTQIGAGLAKAALFAKLDDQELDLSRPLHTPSGEIPLLQNSVNRCADMERRTWRFLDSSDVTEVEL